MVFIHVPKTSGTTINTLMGKHFASGQDHFESIANAPGKVKKTLRQADWVSGHIALNKFIKTIESSTERPYRLYSCIRNPVAQVCSHYNWLIEIYERSQAFYEAHPENLKEVSREVRATDHSKPEAVIAMLTKRPGLFRNLQSRFILGDDIDLSDEAAFHSRLGQFTQLDLSERPEKIVTAITGKTLCDPPLENSSTYHFDTNVFQTPDVLEFLGDFNQHDARLYDLVRKQHTGT